MCFRCGSDLSWELVVRLGEKEDVGGGCRVCARGPAGEKNKTKREREKQKNDPRQADEERGEHTFSAGNMYNVCERAEVVTLVCGSLEQLPATQYLVWKVTCIKLSEKRRHDTEFRNALILNFRIQ